MTTTIQVSEEFRDYIYEHKRREESYEDWIKRHLEVADD